MKNIFIAIFLLVQCHFAGLAAENPVAQKLEKYKDSIAHYGVVVLVQDGKTIYQNAIGVSSEGTNLLTSDRFGIGSCTKMFTATLILKLVQDHVLELKDPITKFSVSKRIKNAQLDSSIKIINLLNHTSGIEDILDDQILNESLKQPDGDFSSNDILSRIQKVTFPAGSKFEYSNVNYYILKEIFEEASHTSLQQALSDLFARLNMRATLPYTAEDIPHQAHPVLAMGSNFQDLSSLPKKGLNAVSIGLGNITSTASDLNKFLRALLMEKTIITDTHLLEMMKDFSTTSGEYGLGLHPLSASYPQLIGHEGRSLYKAFAFMDISAQRSFIILTNNGFDKMSAKIFKELLNYYSYLPESDKQPTH